MAADRDQLWKVSWETYYDAYYFEIVINKVISRWKIFDLITKIIVALTASGSAVAGWSLWSEPGFKLIWVATAGAAAVISILHAVIQVQSILESLSSSRTSFSALRVSIESFRQDLAVHPDFDANEKYESYKVLRNKFDDYVAKFPGDLLLTESLANNSQDKLNFKLGL